MKKIIEGTKVMVHRIAVESEDIISYRATIIHTPSGAGDLWEVEHEDGTIELINPYGRYFDSITKLK